MESVITIKNYTSLVKISLKNAKILGKIIMLDWSKCTLPITVLISLEQIKLNSKQNKLLYFGVRGPNVKNINADIWMGIIQRCHIRKMLTRLA